MTSKTTWYGHTMLVEGAILKLYRGVRVTLRAFWAFPFVSCLPCLVSVRRFGSLGGLIVCLISRALCLGVWLFLICTLALFQDCRKITDSFWPVLDQSSTGPIRPACLSELEIAFGTFINTVNRIS